MSLQSNLRYHLATKVMAGGVPCRRDRRLLVQFCCVFILCARAVHSDEDDDFLQRGEMHDAMDGYHSSSRETSRALHEAGVFKAGNTRAEQDARAQALMADSEADEQQVELAAQKYRRNMQETNEHSADLGEARALPAAPHASPEAERIKRAMQDFDKQQQRGVLDNAETHSDLGEGMEVGSTTTERAEDAGANALTARAQSKARAKAAEAAKKESAAHARKIAAKVKKLVAVQRHLEDEAAVPHNGMVDLKESVDATSAVTQVAQSSMEDSLVAQKMEAEAAQATFKNLIEHEREEQRKVLEGEREKAATLLESVKKTLLKKQQSFLTQMGETEKKVETKLEHALGKTQVAQAVETAVKRKLAKRVEELTTAGKQVVGGVADSVESLKRRVRRLRRSQDRMKNEQSSIERNFASQQNIEHRELGETSQAQQMEQQLKQMQMSMVQQSMSQQRMPQQRMPQQNFAPQMESKAQMENVILKQKLQIAEMKNQLLEKTSYNTLPPNQPALQQYSGQSMQNFFQKRKERKANQDQEKALLAKQIRKEQDSLDRVKAELGVGQAAQEIEQQPSIPMQPDVFLQFADDSTTSDLPNAAPLYHTHKNAAYADSESLQNMARKNSLEILHPH